MIITLGKVRRKKISMGDPAAVVVFDDEDVIFIPLSMLLFAAE